MRRLAVLAVASLSMIAGSAALAADAKPKAPARSAGQMQALSNTAQRTTLSTMAAASTDSPLVRAAKAAVAARLANPGNRIVIDSSTLMVSRYHSDAAPAPAVEAGRSWATGNGADAAQLAAQLRAEQERAAQNEAARVQALRTEQSYMGSQHTEVYTEGDEDQVAKRLTAIPTEMVQPVPVVPPEKPPL
jgi:hypothetical protein